MVSKKQNPLFVFEDGLEKSVTHDHRLSSLGKPIDPRDRFFYPTLTLMIDSYNFTHVILSRLSSEGCILVVLELTHIWSSSDVIVMSKGRHHIIMHFSVSRDIWKLNLRYTTNGE